jgi:hypothetical protein
MIDLSIISDDDIENEYIRRKALKEAAINKKVREATFNFSNNIINRIHDIDRTVPILLYNHEEHGKWKVRRGCKEDPITIPVYQWGYFRRWNLVSKGNMNTEDHCQAMAEKFVKYIWYNGRRMALDDFYFIKWFHVGPYSKYIDDSFYDIFDSGYVLFEYENYNKIIRN